jgi:carbonic anhydrase
VERSLSDLFIVRAASEVVDRSVLASVEYAAEHLHSPVLVVRGVARANGVVL